MPMWWSTSSRKTVRFDALTAAIISARVTRDRRIKRREAKLIHALLKGRRK
jgi:hypothetical protein